MSEETGLGMVVLILSTMPSSETWVDMTVGLSVVIVVVKHGWIWP